MRTTILTSLVILTIMLRSLVFGGEKGPSEGIVSEMRRAEESAAEAKKAAAIAAEKRRQEETARIDKLNEADRLREEAHRLVDDLARQRAETETLKIELTSKLTAHASEKAKLNDEKTTLEKDAEKLEFRQAIFSSSVIGLLLTNLFTIYQLVASRRNRRLEDRKLQLEIELLQQKLTTSGPD
jgi:hypothetical protein